MASVSFFVPGLARGQGRARHSKNGGRPYTPEPTRTKQGVVMSLAMDAVAGGPMLAGPLHMRLKVYVAIPGSWSKKKHAEALCCSLLPTGKPDLSNVLKLVEDSMNGVVFRDDAEIVGILVSKEYAEVPGMLVEVSELFSVGDMLL
jgi:Holliday junction resolvase RusA-like endonuclease